MGDRWRRSGNLMAFSISGEKNQVARRWESGERDGKRERGSLRRKI